MSDDKYSEAVRIVQKHIRHVEQSPGVGKTVQSYAISVCEDILSDIAALPSAIQEPIGYAVVMEGGTGPFVGAWRERWLADQIRDKQPPSHNDVVVPIYTEARTRAGNTPTTREGSAEASGKPGTEARHDHIADAGKMVPDGYVATISAKDAPGGFWYLGAYHGQQAAMNAATKQRGSETGVRPFYFSPERERTALLAGLAASSEREPDSDRAEYLREAQANLDKVLKGDIDAVRALVQVAIDYHDYNDSCADAMDMPEAARFHERKRKELEALLATVPSAKGEPK